MTGSCKVPIIMGIFPKAPPSSLTQEHVIDYLKEWLALGWEVLEEADGSFSIVIGPIQKIGIKHEIAGWVLSGGPGTRRLVKQPHHPLELRMLVETMAREYGVSPQNPPKQVRLLYGSPVTNTGRLVSMIGASIIQAVYDVYLDDKAIFNLSILCNLGVSFSPNLRLLASDRTAPKKLTDQFVSDFFKQSGCTQGKARYTAYTSHENRLLFLDGGDIISLGGSLNNLNINERMHRVADTGEMQLFEKAWNTATLL